MEGLILVDVKANNIMIDWYDKPEEITVLQVKLADLEDATYTAPGDDIVGLQVGNIIWRSPEANCEGPVNTPSDIFSFGIVVRYPISQISKPLNEPSRNMN